MQKTITYLYPDAKNASNLKIYQDRTSQIKAFYFTRESCKNVVNMQSAQNYAIYFLFDNSDDDNQVYIGQSVNGIKRIEEHLKQKEFWSYCILFVTDNNSFDKLSIDYLEYEFIHKFQKSSYVLSNKDIRPNQPNVSIYDKPNLDTFIAQIDFLLKAEGVDTAETKTVISEVKYYHAKSKYNAKIFVRDGKFVLAAGSVIKRPIDTSKQWKDNRHYEKGNRLIDGFMDNQKIKKINDELVTQVNIAFKSPSAIADLITGYSENGWRFFEGLDELREK